jgi:hypothetical protein
VTLTPLRLAAFAATCVLVACASSKTEHVALAPGRPCGKVDAALARILLNKGDDERVGVVVELSTAPRARDVLWAGVADCIPTPSMDGAGSWTGDIPWGAREIGPSSSIPAMCVGWTTRREIAYWCRDPTVRSVEAWR